jgi:hypothetical protein
VDPATLPAGADQHRSDRGLEALVGVGDDQLDPAQAAGPQGAQECGPKRAVLGIADLEARALRRPSLVTPVAITTACDTTRWLTRALQ